MALRELFLKTEETFGNVGWLGLAENPELAVFKDRTRTVTHYRYVLFSDVQTASALEVLVPVSKGKIDFEYEQPVKIVNPRLMVDATKNSDGGSRMVLTIEADDIVKA